MYLGRDEAKGTRVSEGSAVAQCRMRAARAALISRRITTPRRVRAAMASGKEKADVQVDESLGLELVALENERGVGLIVGMAHFIKSVEDLQEALAGSVPNARFGVGFCEASGDRLVRWDGNVKDLAKLARDYAMQINCGHAFVCCVENCFPIHVLNAIKAVPEVATVYCATNNPVMIVVANATSKFHTGRGIMGIVDGRACVGVEEQEQQAGRRKLLQDVGLKFGPNYEK